VVVHTGDVEGSKDDMWNSIHIDVAVHTYMWQSSSGHVADAGDMEAELAVELAGDVAPSWQVTWCRIIRGYHVATSE
jgi:hypothetical protein